MNLAVAEERVPLVEDQDTGHRFLIYGAEQGFDVELLYEGDTFWASQTQMVEMFAVDQSGISRHVRNVLETGELSAEGNMQKLHISSTKPTVVYSLDMLISVGYRVNSKQGTMFRIWATDKLVQILTKGFYIDPGKLKGRTDHIAELREIIRDIRADEANSYAELRRIIAMCPDYNPRSKTSRNFFANFQNRILYAITGHTAAEIVKLRADARKPDMGLQTWSAKRDYPLQPDVTVSKNYLGPIEMKDLNRLVVMVLDFFEDQTDRGWLVSVDDADQKLLEILTVNRRKMLQGFGNISHEQAEDHSKRQYKIFDKARREERKANALAELNERSKALPKPKRKSRRSKSPGTKK